MKKVVCIIVWLLSVSFSYGGEIVLSGVYHGTSIFVQNPYNQNKAAFCTKEVYVNDRKLFDVPQISAFKIDLNHLQLNDLVVIRITYDDGCSPRVVNSHVIRQEDKFQFIYSQSDNQSITWSTSGETPTGEFVLERYDQSAIDWKKVKAFVGKGNLEANIYAMPASHHTGNNRYRLKYKDTEGQVYYSVELSYSAEQRVTFYPLVASDKLTLSDSTEYAIEDYYGKIVLSGSGSEVSLDDLRPGEYYIYLNSQKQKFVKK